jgi:dimethylaniline monooxygenase (N-oxide forming)
MTYLNSYARHFGVLDCIRFGHRVLGMQYYYGVTEKAVAELDEEWAPESAASLLKTPTDALR